MINSEPMKDKGKTIKHPHTDIATIRHVPWKKGESKYEIYIFKKYSPTGKAQRLYRKTERDAKDYANALANERKSFGSHALKQFTPDQRADAERAFAVLHETNFTNLYDAVSFLRDLKKSEKAKSPITITEIIEDKITDIANKNAQDAKGGSARTLQEYHYRGRKVLGEAYGSMRVVDFDNDTHFIPLWKKHGQEDHLLRVCKSIFNFCVKKYKGQVIKECPITEEKFKRKRDEPKIFQQDEWQRFIITALLTNEEKFRRKNTYALAPWAVLGLWCGLRPHAELRHLDWKDINLDKKIVYVHSHKTHKARWVDIPNCAVGILRSHEKEQGAVVNPKNLDKRERALKDRAGVSRPIWANDIMRHTFASMHWAKHQDEGKLISLLGHKDDDQLMHYRRFEKGLRDQAQEFWNFNPSA